MLWISIWGCHVLTSLDSSLGQSCGQCFGCKHGDVSVLWWKRGSSVVGEGVVREFRECRKNEKDVGKKVGKLEDKKTTTKHTHTFFHHFSPMSRKTQNELSWKNNSKTKHSPGVDVFVDVEVQFRVPVKLQSLKILGSAEDRKNIERNGAGNEKRVNSSICKRWNRKILKHSGKI